MVNNSKANKLARYAITFATIIVAMMLDRQIGIALTLGFSKQLSTAAIVILITFSFCFLDDSWATAILAWTFFGLASLLKEFIPGWESSVALLPIYVRPVVTIVPRVISGAVAFGSYKLMLRFTAKMKNARRRQIVAMVVAIFLGNVTNTVFFLSTLNIFKIAFNVEFTALFELIKIAALTNILPEYTISMAVAPFVVLGVRRGLKLGVDGDNWKRAKTDEQATTVVEQSVTENETANSETTQQNETTDK